MSDNEPQSDAGPQGGSDNEPAPDTTDLPPIGSTPQARSEAGSRPRNTSLDPETRPAVNTREDS